MKTIWKTALCSAALASLAITPLASQAAIINDLLIPGVNEFQDTDAERILGSTGGVKTSGKFVVGDTIEAILRFDTVNATTIATAHPAPYQLTAYSRLLVVAITDTTGGACDAGDPTCLLVFGPDGTLGAGVMANIYENSKNTLPSMFTKSPALGIIDATAPALVAQFGIGEVDDFWASTFPNVADPIALIATLGAKDPQIPQGVFGLSLIGASSIPMTENAMLGADGNYHTVVGNASVYQRSPGVNTGWLVSSNLSVQFQVPEPGTLALFGVAALLSACVTRRRQI